MTRILRADGVSATAYTYEAQTNRKKTVTDPKGQVLTLAYALDDKTLSETYTNDTSTTPNVSYAYDPHYKRVLTMVDGTGTTTYTYKPVSALGALHLASIDGPLANDTITYDYDELGRVINRAINSVGSRSSTTYDALGRVVTQTNSLGTFTSTYDGLTRRLATLTYPNGQVATFTYFPNLAIAACRRFCTSGRTRRRSPDSTTSMMW